MMRGNNYIHPFGYENLDASLHKIRSSDHIIVGMQTLHVRARLKWVLFPKTSWSKDLIHHHNLFAHVRELEVMNEMFFVWIKEHNGVG
jgi:hypothetical protein